MGTDAKATAKLLVHEMGEKAYGHAMVTAVNHAKAGDFKSASFWRSVADHVGVKVPSEPEMEACAPQAIAAV
jgi:hypothetical protein